MLYNDCYSPLLIGKIYCKEDDILKIIIYTLIIYIVYKIYNSKTRLIALNDPKFIQLITDAESFSVQIDEYKKDYFTDTRKQIMLNTYKDLYFKIKRDYKNNKNHILDNFIATYNDLNNLVEEWNKQYIKNELLENKYFFDDIDNKSLDLQQREAIVIDEDNNLIIAGAGSGKTLTISGKVKYLVKKKKVDPENILLLSFTKKSSEEMQERITNRLNMGVEVRTFHSLGYHIITRSKTYKPDVCNDMRKVINRYFKNEVTKDKNSIRKIINFFGYYFNIPEDLDKVENLGEMHDNIKNLDLETIKSKIEKVESMLKSNKNTLQGEVVKSLEEVSIANYLYLNGINYEYEKVYPFKSDEKYRKLYRPDFYLTDYDIYIEHFGITRDYKTPWLSKIEEEKYIDSIHWKRKFHKENGTKLLETYSYMNKEGMLLSELKNMLRANNVEFKAIDYNYIYKTIFIDNDDKYFHEFTKLVSTFINLYKSKGYSYSDFKTIKSEVLDIDNKFLKNRSLVFLEIVAPIFKYYEEFLKSNKKIDYNDMINMATSIIKSDQTRIYYDYIIIDEYQDISMSRYNLIKAIKETTQAKIMAVGDDWQSIYRFTGSDISLFTEFQKHFGYSKLLKLERTYRNSQELINIAGEFIMKNPSQYKKDLISSKHHSNSVRIIGYNYNFIDAFTKAIDEIIYLNGNEAEICLLGRNNFDIDLFREDKVNEEKLEKESKKTLGIFEAIDTNIISITKIEDTFKIIYKQYPKLKLTFMTVHKSKGLEAENVIILNLRNKLLGFPNKISDDPLLSLVLTNYDNFQYAEERRLFYVALTRTKNVNYLLTQDYNKSIFVDELIRKQNIKYNILENEVSISDNPICPLCQTGHMVLRENTISNSKFLGCSNYPLCDNTFNNIEILNDQIICQSCGGYMIRKSGPYGEFYGCTNYPYCRNKLQIQDVSTIDKDIEYKSKVHIPLEDKKIKHELEEFISHKPNVKPLNNSKHQYNHSDIFGNILKVIDEETNLKRSLEKIKDTTLDSAKNLKKKTEEKTEDKINIISNTIKEAIINKPICNDCIKRRDCFISSKTKTECEYYKPGPTRIPTNWRR